MYIDSQENENLSIKMDLNSQTYPKIFVKNNFANRY